MSAAQTEEGPLRGIRASAAPLRSAERLGDHRRWLTVRQRVGGASPEQSAASVLRVTTTTIGDYPFVEHDALLAIAPPALPTGRRASEYGMILVGERDVQARHGCSRAVHDVGRG
jgi:hypothetical protein